MAIRLTPPSKMVFNMSVVLGVLALILYFINLFEVAVVPIHLAFWVAMAGWVLMLAGVAMKGV